jgi:hypothetical protein
MVCLLSSTQSTTAKQTRNDTNDVLLQKYTSSSFVHDQIPNISLGSSTPQEPANATSDQIPNPMLLVPKTCPVTAVGDMQI